MRENWKLDDLGRNRMQFKAVGGVRINVAVLAYDDKVLWDCRNFLYDLSIKRIIIWGLH